MLRRALVVLLREIPTLQAKHQKYIYPVRCNRFHVPNLQMLKVVRHGPGTNVLVCCISRSRYCIWLPALVAPALWQLQVLLLGRISNFSLFPTRATSLSVVQHSSYQTLDSRQSTVERKRDQGRDKNRRLGSLTLFKLGAELGGGCNRSHQPVGVLARN